MPTESSTPQRDLYPPCNSRIFPPEFLHSRWLALVVGTRGLTIGQMDDDPPHGFNQTFVLKPLGDSFFVQHDFFRLALHHIAIWTLVRGARQGWGKRAIVTPLLHLSLVRHMCVTQSWCGMHAVEILDVFSLLFLLVIDWDLACCLFYFFFFVCKR